MSENGTSEEDRKIIASAGPAANRGGGRWGAIGVPTEQSGDFKATLKRLGELLSHLRRQRIDGHVQDGVAGLARDLQAQAGLVRWVGPGRVVLWFGDPDKPELLLRDIVSVVGRKLWSRQDEVQQDQAAE